jgi:hypothetical protein
MLFRVVMPHELIPIAIAVVVAILITAAIVSFAPKFIKANDCGTIPGDSNNNGVEDAGETWTGDPGTNAWVGACRTSESNLAVVAIIIGIIIAFTVLAFITKLFSN